MKKRFLHDISVNTLQVMIIQACGLVIFYLLSTLLEKNDFGEMNWSLAVLLTAFTVLSFGIEQISIRRIASGADTKQTLALYLSHVFLWGLLFYLLLLSGKLFFPAFFKEHHLLLLLGLGKLMLFFSTPFKQVANGLERFRPLLLMAICSNLVRSVALLIAAMMNRFDLTTVVIIFIAGDIAEFFVSWLIMQFVIKVPAGLLLDRKAYKNLVRESIPQLGVTIFSSVLSRFDWILLGLLAGNVILANYSFAYKVFEVATLPMLIIAPILVPRFTRLFSAPVKEDKLNDLFVLLRIELIIASVFALLLNVLWVPVIDLITHNKYGEVNRQTIFLLSIAMPFLYFNNFLWTINFARGRLKMIFYVFLASFVVNVTGDVLLIPFWKAEGAAIAYLAAIVLQALLYYRQTKLEGLEKNILPLLLCPALAALCGVVCSLLFNNPWIIALISLFSCLVLFLLFRQLRRSDWPVIKRVAGF